MFITWDEKVTTSRGAETRKGIVATRGDSTDNAYHVTATTARDGGAFAKVSVKRGAHGKNLVTDHVVAAGKVNGDVLALVRGLEAADRADGAPIEQEVERTCEAMEPDGAPDGGLVVCGAPVADGSDACAEHTVGEDTSWSAAMSGSVDPDETTADGDDASDE